ncbi:MULTISPECIES: response regulator transcription factor [unclassified Staphylococcus]|uniref:response regulator transcription factor n=1 Tax=unclassified Staphylococcus TaxID=91994 RepID=UPI0021CF2315|nr:MULTISPECIES: response regulator transcription factor [unclassified Staphylococcus]UXR69214.1 response regulator transcription factor [Staphylococcus sp. IVB6246]UXR71270.1 response regulator transcription factor [Staphylococcus sp. IVB6240]UXR73545.1 response regulator transcription factor [Staphylococcus sp. IVB6238]UXR75862.1 response regulator transcription factor [Staphylococcus sp. IVB6233]UXR81472.1 response regulator transcription factor [Staphylococcus sp. IVB6218]
MEHILIVDDEPDIRDICKTYFEFEGYAVSTATNGQEALDKLDASIDLMILDIMMPDKDGYAVVKEMHAQQLDIPYIYLTAKTTESDAIYGLMLGADDYVKKPFSPRELVIRAKNILKRVKQNPIAQDTLTFGSLSLDNLTKTVTIHNKTVSLRVKEFELLWYFATHENVALSKTDLLEQVWGYDYYEDMNTLNVHIHRLREKLEQHQYNDYAITTVWGLGYKFQRRH